MMGLRADMTPQVARIATTRLAHAPRPLRLSYAGQCLRVRGSQLAPERQVAQAGIELIGADSPEADAEIVLVGAEALAAVGLTRLSFDLTLPTLVPALLDEAGSRPRACVGRSRTRSTARTRRRWRGTAGARAHADRPAARRRRRRRRARRARCGRAAAGRRAPSPIGSPPPSRPSAAARRRCG